MVNFRNQDITPNPSKATENEKNLKQLQKAESIKITWINVICFI